jgi:hypothetical protein
MVPVLAIDRVGDHIVLLDQTRWPVGERLTPCCQAMRMMEKDNFGQCLRAISRRPEPDADSP